MPTTAELPLSAAPDVPIRDASRLLDLLLAAGIMIFVLPLMAFCALAVRLSGPGPVLFRQKRIGRGGAEFDCFKFRTMSHQADSRIEEILRHCQQSQEQWAALQKLTRDPRVTPIGRVLRRYCLDELPQLFNVLAGQMSIVGPRPIVASEILRYGPMFGHYCSVRPGLTGLWQVSGRHALSYDQRVQLDAEYAQSKCARLDLWILVRTVPVVLLGENE
jgi:lipopolysaccharide/colanic/teichoic acid biosynthesis glycosyltransferase